MNQPDFPSHNYVELQRSKVQVGDNRNQSWETTYSSFVRPLQAEAQTKKVDTFLLQKTHWTPGNLPMTTESEAHANFQQFKELAKRDPAYTRDQMMKTTFSLGNDTEGFAKRNLATEYREKAPKRVNLGDKMKATHFSITTPEVNSWETTSSSSYKPLNAEPAKPFDPMLAKGLGAKTCFEQLGAFKIPETSSRDAFAKSKTNPTETASSRNIGIKDKYIVFDQGKTQANQKTNVKLGGIRTEYSTTMNDGFVKDNEREPVDMNLARQRKACFSRSSIKEGLNSVDPVTRSTMKDSILPHPECKREPLAERTAFVSHLKYKDGNEILTTTMGDAFKEKNAEVRKPFNMALQSSHYSIGYEGIKETNSLYRDTFTKPESSIERVNSNELRRFHTSHHSRIDTRSASSLGQTTYGESYQFYKDFKPSPSCSALKSGSNIVPNEERFNLKQSNMKESFQIPKRMEQEAPKNNSLQNSHIHFKSTCPKWTTTQQDYFLFNKFKTRLEE